MANLIGLKSEKMISKKIRIGLIGFGTIGKAIYKMAQSNLHNNLEIVFINDLMEKNLWDVGHSLILNDIKDFEIKKPDLIIEMAHPSVTRHWGKYILEKCDYMMVSATALADKDILEMVESTTKKYCTRAYIPHGGVIGADALYENREIWESVEIVMKKPVKNIDFSESGIDPSSIKNEMVIFDGPTRNICPLFPRNVNTHAIVAYAGIGFDKTRSILMVSPDYNKATVTIKAKGKGVVINIDRVEDISGVTGASTPSSIYNSIQMVCPAEPGIHLK